MIPHPSRKIQILVVDDHDSNRVLLKALLEYEGFEVITADNGESAFQCAVENPPGLVISDVLMPIMDGFSLCRLWKNHEVLKSIPFVICTGTYLDEEDKKLATRLGVDLYVQKPVDNMVLLENINSLLGNSVKSSAPEREDLSREEFYQVYNIRLVKKLEQKVQQLRQQTALVEEKQQQLELINRQLEEQITDRATLLEDYNEERQAFSHFINHDLRRQLRVINGHGSVILNELRDTLPPKHAEYFEKIIEAGRDMNALINNLTTLSRVVTDNVHHQIVDLSRLAWEIIDDLSQRYSAHPLEFDIQEGMKVEGDLPLLKLALQHLLDNAFKFSEPKESTFIRFGTMEAQGEDRMVFFIQDHGVGFNVRDANRLFLPFQKLHPTGSFKGVGMGLSTVRRIIRLHCGYVWAQGKIDEGASFYFALPLKQKHKTVRENRFEAI